MTLNLGVDFETASECKLNERGAPIYARDPSTHLLCMAYGFTPQDVKIWVPGDPFPYEEFNNAETISAWNAAFEIWIWEFVARRLHDWPALPFDKVRCTMAKARYNNRPGSLDKAGEILKLPANMQKDKRGGQLIQLLSIPQKDGTFNKDPVLMQEMCDYCKQDVRAELTIDSMLLPMPQREVELWKLDRQLNMAGCPLDVPYCKSAYSLVQEIGRKANAEVEAITGGDISTTSQVAKLLKWVQARGVNIANLQADSVDWALAGKNAALADGKIQPATIDPQAARMLELRQVGAPAAVKKYKAAINQTWDDGLSRDQIIYYGASQTGRFAGSGIQLHNLFRETADDSIVEAIGTGDLEILQSMTRMPSKALQTGVRAMVSAPAAHSLLISDFSAIEARVVLWLARAKRGLGIFAKYDAGQGPEPYRVVGGGIFSVKPETIGKNDKPRRVGKAACLGLGFGMGATKFQSTAKTMAGVDLDMPMCEKTVKFWRKSNPEVVKFWYDLQEGFAAATNGAKKFEVGLLTFSNENGSVGMRLPSGRQLFYHEPKVLRGGNIRFTDPKRGRIETWGGLLAENATQATARDLMIEALFRLHEAGFRIALHIHDEIIALILDTLVAARKDEFHQLMTVLPSWAKGCPIVSETHVSKRLTK